MMNLSSPNSSTAGGNEADLALLKLSMALKMSSPKAPATPTGVSAATAAPAAVTATAPSASPDPAAQHDAAATPAPQTAPQQQEPQPDSAPAVNSSDSASAANARSATTTSVAHSDGAQAPQHTVVQVATTATVTKVAYGESAEVHVAQSAQEDAATDVGELDEAEAQQQLEQLFQQVIESLRQSKLEQAYADCQAMLALAPENAQAMHLLGLVWMGRHQHRQAIHWFTESLRLQPNDMRTWFNLGLSLFHSSDLPRSLRAFGKVLELAPKMSEAWFYRAMAWQLMGEHAAAGRDASMVLQINPDHLEALKIMGNSLLALRAFDKALDVFTRIETEHPGQPFVACIRAFVQRQLCVWDDESSLPAPDAAAPEADAAEGLNAEAAALDQLARLALENRPALEPFSSIVLLDRPDVHRACTALWMRNLHPPLPLPAEKTLITGPVPTSDNPHPKLRIAYISCDFHEHATAYLVAGLFEQHSPQAVELYMISYGAQQNDAMRNRLIAASHKFVDASAMSDAQIGDFCRDELKIHIAIDLKGLTRNSRPGIFAQRIAPLQINWLGYPGTLASGYHDYLIADDILVHPESRAYYQEAIAYMPSTYQATDDSRSLSAEPHSRSQYGLPADGLVLCSFNNSFKFSPQVWAVWMRVLVQHPNAVLWLLECHPKTMENLQQHAVAAGVAAERIVFSAIIPQEQHLARLRLADLSLDTLPCNAHTTASDALWAEVPHITCMGQSLAARVGASLLHALAMPELITDNLADYEAKILHLAQDREALVACKKKIQQNKAQTPLFNTPQFARNMETAFRQMWTRHCAGHPPADFHIAGPQSQPDSAAQPQTAASIAS